MALKDDLKKKLPEYQRGNDALDQLLDAVGELLDNFKQEIDNQANFSDFELIEEKNIEALAKQFDIEFPRNMSLRRRRDYLREAVTLYRSKGTSRSLERVFRLIGWQVEIVEYFIVDPEWHEINGATYTLTNEQGASFNLTYDPTSTDQVYTPIEGEIKTSQDRLLVNLTDPSGNIYPNRQIYGQNYAVDDDVTFMKVPYIKIRITVEDFDLFTSDYIGEDGNVYTYDTSEEFEIYQTIQTYFLPRIIPANVAILSVSTPFALDDTIQWVIQDTTGVAADPSDNLTFVAASNTITRSAGSFITDGYKNEDFINISGTTNNNGRFKIRQVTATTLYVYTDYPVVDEGPVASTVSNESFRIESKNAGLKYNGLASYGHYNIDPYILGESMGQYKYDSNSEFEYYGVRETNPQDIVVRNYGSDITVGSQPIINIRKNTNLQISVPASPVQSVIVYGVKNSPAQRTIDPPDFEIIDILNENESLNVDLKDYFGIFLNINIVPTGGTNITVTLTMD
jgi:hypothetical protein